MNTNQNVEILKELSETANNTRAFLIGGEVVLRRRIAELNEI